ncbi:glycoside hydrolase family 9 protein [Acetivibrio clariflavus]|uniref:glycoside hydrolase family 9 protein n=1 Tax=Acetivibrio clariflavus TaxID=288965 RepID=UPI000481CA05|nr:glycoside hydrolase family 9 protein [Acetivibrio clariflavus]
MRKGKVSLFLVVTLLASLLTPAASKAATPPEDYRKLQDIQIFLNKPVTGWSGSGAEELETENSTLPVDATEKYNGLPSLRLNVSKAVTSGWWISLLTLREWNTHDISQYVENGFIEFNIKGKDGGENFIIGLRDKVYERAIGTELDVKTVINKYIDISTEWQHVKIPLRDIVTAGGGFDATSVTCLFLEKAHVNPFTVWINDLKITSPDNEKSFTAIKVNQVGFLPDAEKYALVTGFMEELQASEGTAFEVRSAKDDSVVYEGKLTLVTECEPIDSGEKILKADFSDLTEEGEYYICVSGIEEKSYKFKIGSNLYEGLLYDALRYFYYQRQGIDLVEPYAQGFARKDLTPMDNAVRSQLPTVTKTFELTKGWYDAGDFGKYVNAGATALSDLFWTYEMFTENMKNFEVNIPESGDSIPDILDEARWELEWMLKMQDPVSGGFYPRVQSDNDDNITMRILKNANGCTTDDSACAAAVLAHAYLLYKDIDSEFAEKCLEAAEVAWKFLEKNPKNIVSPSGPYNVTNDRADRLWAAASLYRATGDEVYNTYFLNNYKSFEGNFTNSYAYAHTWGNMWLTAYICYMKADNVDESAAAWIKTAFGKWLNLILNRYENNPWNNTIVPGNYYWGINMQVMNVPMDAIIVSQFVDSVDISKVREMAFGSLNWLLGTNPMSISYVSGHGENSVKRVYSIIYNNDGKPGIPNGYMPGGPNAYEGAGLSRFAAKCYTTSSGDWVANEHTVYWNSALVFMAAYANSKQTVGFILGDVDGNGKIDSIDFATLKQYMLGMIKTLPSPYEEIAADVDGNGTINVIDLAYLKKYLLGMISKFPAEVN